MKALKFGLNRKLVASYFLLALVLATALGFWFRKTYRDRVVADLKADISAHAALLSAEYHEGLFDRDAARLQVRVVELGKLTRNRITLVDPLGHVLADSEEDPRKMENHASRPEILQAVAVGYGESKRYSTTLKTEMLYFAETVKDRAGLRGVVRVAVPASRIEEGMTRINAVLAWSLLFSAFLAVALSTWVVRTVSDRVLDIAAAVRKIRSGDFSARLWSRERDDIGQLASDVNEMAEELVRRSATAAGEKEKLDQALSALNAGLLAVDAEDRLTFWNSSAYQLLVWNDIPRKKQPVADVLRISRVLEVLRESRATAEKALSDVSFLREGTERTLAVAVFPLKESADGARIIVLRDITETRKLERARRDFVANASHELKTPLTAIKGYADTLLEGAGDDPVTRKRFLSQLSENVNRLVALSDDLLELSRIEESTERPVLASVDVRKILRNTFERFVQGAENKGVSLTCDTNDDGFGVLTHAESLSRILDNLVDNAVKYTPESGSIDLKLRVEEGRAVIDVEDTGVGISPADLDRVFERFYRVDKARSIGAGGTGLGLSIVKHLAQQIQSEIRVTSEIGKGTKFTLLLPLSL